MLPSTFLLIVACGFSAVSLVISVAAKSSPIRYGENCGLNPDSFQTFAQSKQNLQSFPGAGWDNLNNEPMAAVFDLYSYEKCRLTPDRLHLVPDYVDVIPIKETTVDRFANYYEDYLSYFHSTSHSVNFGTGVGFRKCSIGGSYSHSYTQTKRITLTTSTSIMQTNIKTHAYSLMAEPDAPLSPDFKDRVLEIGENLRQNKTSMAKYLSQLIVRDYGTHVITRVESGAIIHQADFVDKSKATDAFGDSKTNRAAAAASFFKVIHFDSSTATTVNDSVKQAYDTITKHSILKAQGGPDLNSLLQQGSWKTPNTTLTDLVALNRAGDFLYYYIVPLNIPELPEPIVNAIQALVQNATQTYYDKNTVSGCMSSESPNFKYVANLDDGSCKQPYSNYSFGGVYQTCAGTEDACSGLNIANDYSGGTFCPDGYSPIYLGRSINTYKYDYTHCTTTKHFCLRHLFHGCAHTTCSTQHETEEGTVEMFWCNASRVEPPDSGYMFGGAYTDRRANPFTRDQSCPGMYEKFTMGVNEYQFTICLSRDYELDAPYSVPFGGFISCEVNGGPQKCPKGYSQHLLQTIEDVGTTSTECALYYCVRTGDMKEPGDNYLERPPYMKVPLDMVADLNIHVLQDGRMWIYDDNSSTWDAAQDVGATGEEVLNKYADYLNKTEL